MQGPLDCELNGSRGTKMALTLKEGKKFWKQWYRVSPNGVIEFTDTLSGQLCCQDTANTIHGMHDSWGNYPYVHLRRGEVPNTWVPSGPPHLFALSHCASSGPYDFGTKVDHCGGWFATDVITRYGCRNACRHNLHNPMSRFLRPPLNCTLR